MANPYHVTGIDRSVRSEDNAQRWPCAVAAEWEGVIMRRPGVIVALGALLGMFGGVVTASPALARGPKWQFLPVAPLTLPAAFCSFEVRVMPMVDREYAKILKASDGSMITLITGSLKGSYTNLSTGKSFTENHSGPAKVTVSPDGSALVAARGRNPVFLTPSDAQRFGLPTVSVTAGLLTASFAPDGSITSLSLQGHVVVDVCAALS
jgi:hypothetical protein